MIRSALLALLLTVPTAWAQQPPAAAAQPPADPARAAPLAAADSRDDEDANTRHCLRSTGSRVVEGMNRREARRSNERTPARLWCASGIGRSYSQHDLQSTGATNVADALRMLDPRIR